MNPRTIGALFIVLILHAGLLVARVQQTAVDVQVTVLDGKTRQALRGATIYIGGTTARDGSGRTLRTDDEGRLTIKNIVPGKHALEASRSGYVLSGLVERELDVPAVYRSLTVPVSFPAEASAKLTVYMLRSPAISGSVVDAKGQPVGSALIVVLRYAYNANGERTLVRFAPGPFTDDRGQFEIDVIPPGEYVFRAEDTPIRNRFSPVYYPSTVEASRADVVKVNPGDEIQLRPLVLQPLPNGTLWVTLQDESKYAVPGLAFLAARRAGDQMDPGASSLGSYLRLTQGVYDVEVGARMPNADALPGTTNGAWSTRVSIEIRDKDVQSTITVRPGTKVSGRLVKREKSGNISTWKGALVQLTPARTFNTYSALGLQAYTDTDGTFSFVSVPAGSYELQLPSAGGTSVFIREGDLRPAPRDLCIAEIRQNNETIPGERVDIAGQTTALSVVLAESATRVEGRVVDGRGRVADGAVVALIPDDRRQERGFVSGQTDQNGSFEFKCIPAGSYRLFAWNDLPGAAWRNQEFMANYLGRGTPVRVNEDGTTTVQTTILEQ